MKLTRLFAGTLCLMAIAAMSSCSSDEGVTEQPKQPQTITLTINNGADTRLALESDGAGGLKSSWESGDAVAVVLEGTNSPIYKFTTTGTGSTAVFTQASEGELTEGMTYNVFYPYSLTTDGINMAEQTGKLEDLKSHTMLLGWGDYKSGKIMDGDKDAALSPYSIILRIPAGTPLVKGTSAVTAQIIFTMDIPTFTKFGFPSEVNSGTALTLKDITLQAKDGNMVSSEDLYLSILSVGEAYPKNIVVKVIVDEKSATYELTRETELQQGKVYTIEASKLGEPKTLE